MIKIHRLIWQKASHSLGKTKVMNDFPMVAEKLKYIEDRRAKIDPKWFGMNGERFELFNLAEDENIWGNNALRTRYYLTKSAYELDSVKSSSGTTVQTHKCAFEDFVDILRQTAMSIGELKELETNVHQIYLSVKEDPTINDVALCTNSEVRRHMIKNIGYDKVKGYATILDRWEDYELMDIHCEGMNLGRWMKMVDTTTKRLYLHPVPPEIDMGRSKIPVKTCKQALAWTFGVSPTEYSPIKET